MAALIRRKTLFCRVRYPVGVPVGTPTRRPEVDGYQDLVDGLVAMQGIVAEHLNFRPVTIEYVPAFFVKIFTIIRKRWF